MIIQLRWVFVIKSYIFFWNKDFTNVEYRIHGGMYEMYEIAQQAKHMHMRIDKVCKIGDI